MPYNNIKPTHNLEKTCLIKASEDLTLLAICRLVLSLIQLKNDSIGCLIEDTRFEYSLFAALNIDGSLPFLIGVIISNPFFFNLALSDDFYALSPYKSPCSS